MTREGGGGEKKKRGGLPWLRWEKGSYRGLLELGRNRALVDEGK